MSLDQERDQLVGMAESRAFNAIQFLTLDDAVLSESVVLASRRLGRRHHSLRFCTADGAQAAAAATLFGAGNVDLLPPWR